MRFQTLQIKSDLLAENTGYGLDKIEHHWKEYNGTSVDYVIDFDSTIVKLRTKIDEAPTKYPLSSVEVQNLLKVLEGEMGRSEIQKIIGLKDVKHCRENYLEPYIGSNSKYSNIKA
jgi:hypothetical protein